MNSDIFTDEYQILTPHGFVDFDGIRKTDKDIGITLYLSDDSRFICKDDHEIKTIKGFVKAKNAINCALLKWNKEVTIDKITKNTEEENFYDILEIKNEDHSFYSNDIVSHNCDFIGSVSTLIDHNFLKELKPTEPMKIPKLPDCVKIWELPRNPKEMEVKNWEYVASLDSGYGIHADYTVLQICLVKSNITIHQVAKIYSNKMDIDEFCKKARNLLKCYNDPRLIIEQNGPGIAAMQFFHLKAEYENLLHFHPAGKHMGLWATDRLKETACILLKTCVQRNFLKLKDRETIEELHSFGKTTQKKWGALGGNHDDHVTSIYWITYYVNTPFFYGNVVEVDMKKVSEDELLLTTEEERAAAEKVMSDVKNPNFHKEELKKGEEFLPEPENEGVMDESGENSEDGDGIETGSMFRV